MGKRERHGRYPQLIKVDGTDVFVQIKGIQFLQKNLCRVLIRGVFLTEPDTQPVTKLTGVH